MVKTIIPKDLNSNPIYSVRGLHGGVVISIFACFFMVVPAVTDSLYWNIIMFLLLSNTIVFSIPKMYKIRYMELYFTLNFIGMLYGSLSLTICFYAYMNNSIINNFRLFTFGMIAVFSMAIIECLIVIRTKHHLTYQKYIADSIKYEGSKPFFNYPYWNENEAKANIKLNPSKFYLRIIGVLIVPILVLSIFGKGYIGSSLIVSRIFDNNGDGSLILYIMSFMVFIFVLFINKMLVHNAFITLAAFEYISNRKRELL